MATLKIQRTREYLNLFRNYVIYIDGQKIGHIGNGELKEYEINSGSHTVFARIDWCRSSKVTFIIKDNDSKTILVGGIKNGKRIMPLLTAMIALAIILPKTAHSYYKLLLILPPFFFLLYIFTLGSKKYLTLTEIQI